MRRSRWFTGLFLLLVIAPAGTAAAAVRGPSCATQSKIVESTIAAVARDLKGQEYCQFRHYHALDDVDGDGTDDFIVLFSVEGMGGGNGHEDFMAVFLSGRNWHPLTTRTGGRGERDPISVEVKNHRIVLETLVYRPSDAMCCPSGKGTLIYEIQGKGLQLVAQTVEGADPAAPPDRDKAPSGELKR
jgi:hypothetical protein